MTRARTSWLAGVLTMVVSALSMTPLRASAQFDEWTEVPTFQPSPENFGIELRIGTYQMELGPVFDSFFGNDVGPMLSAEIDYFPVRLAFLGMVGIGVQVGWSQWDAPALGGSTTTDSDTSPNTSIEVFPLNATLLLRFDTLARELNFPLVLTPKVGFDAIYWTTGSEGQTDADGWSFGPRFGGQAALELDFLEPRAARQLDEEWGINHVALFFEAYYSMAGEFSRRQLDVGGWAWAAGLQMIF